MNDGQVLVDAGKDDVVRLVLNGVTLHCETAPAIYAPQAATVVFILADGTENAVSDGDYSVVDSDDAPDAAIFAQDCLSITGGGMLNVTGTKHHGIRTQDTLVITGGAISVTSAGDALRGRDGVAVRGVSLTLNAGGDGIQSNNNEDDAKGFVVIDGGDFVIQAGSDGIQAQSALTVYGGTFRIATGGGSSNAPTHEEDFRGVRGGQNSATAAAEDESVSMKALKAGKLLTITDGNFTIDAEDDAVHSNDGARIRGGSFAIKTGDDGFHANGALEISDGEINIPTCYEGIEGLSVTISGGEISVAASDDAINAAGGATGEQQGFGPMGQDRFAVDGDIFIRVSGGTLDLYATRDGLDANGNIFLEGGTIKISGPSQGMEGAIDLDGSMFVTGGELITAGSVLNASQDSTQPLLLVSYAEQQPSGSLIAIKDADGNSLLEYTAKTSFTLSGFTSKSFAIGETYSLFINSEKRVEVKLESIATSIGDDGGEYNGGRGMGRGDWGGATGGGTRPAGGRPQGDWNGEMPEWDGETPPEGFTPGGRGRTAPPTDAGTPEA
jgi:hypothetical protein